MIWAEMICLVIAPGGSLCEEVAGDDWDQSSEIPWDIPNYQATEATTDYWGDIALGMGKDVECGGQQISDVRQWETPTNWTITIRQFYLFNLVFMEYFYHMIYLDIILRI